MKTFLKIIIFTLILVCVFFISMVISVAMGGSALTGFIFCLTLISIVLFGFLIRMLWLRRREKKFIDGILEGEENDAGAEDSELKDEMVQRWKEAMTELKKSELKYHRNPLYVLPWYMVIGDSGSGKTTAIENSGLTSKYSSPESVSGISGTKNCNWWFFEEAIVIDTAGRYAVHQDEVSDKEEWRIFLRQLSKYRKKEPLNGLIVTIPSDKLLGKSEKEIEAEGKAIRIRLEELMQTLGAKFPVYVLVTKLDLVYGMNEFAEELTEDSRKQSFGFINENLEIDTSLFIENGFKELLKTIGDYRLRISNLPGEEKISSKILFFPEEFSELKNGLELFVNSAFDKSIYQEAPVLRGVYFTSGRQDGTPESIMRKNLSFEFRDHEKDPREESFFLHHIFSKILPDDRYLFSLTRRAKDYRKKLNIMKLSTWVASIFTICSLLSWSFWFNIDTIRNFKDERNVPKVLSGKLQSDIETLEKIKEKILKIEAQNNESWLPRFGLTHSVKVEDKLKKAYCDLLNNDLLKKYDENLSNKVLDYSRDTEPEELSKSIPVYIKRINLLKKSMEEAEFEELSAMPQPDYKFYLEINNNKILPRYLDIFRGQYLYYLIWSSEKYRAVEEKGLKENLAYLIKEKKTSLDWLVNWCNRTQVDKGYNLNSFWLGNKEIDNNLFIKPAYTINGFDLMEDLIRQYENAIDSSLLLEKEKIGFKEKYFESYMENWFEFSKGFQTGLELIKSEEHSKTIATLMAEKKGPYFKFLEKMSQELNICKEYKENVPEWIEYVFSLEKLKELAIKAENNKNKGLIKNIAKKSTKFLGKPGKVIKGEIGKSKDPELLVSEYINYTKNLSEISKAGISNQSSFNLALKTFEQDPAVGKSPVFVSKRAYDYLIINLGQNSNKKEKIIGRLLAGPFEYLWRRVCSKSGCYLQESWDSDVLAEVEEVADRKARKELLFGKKGYIKKFLEKKAGAFIVRKSRKGYYPKETAGQIIPFKNEFFKYITRGEHSVQNARSEYKLRFEADGATTNHEGLYVDHTVLELQCAEDTQVLEHWNFPMSKTFIWSPSECGDVSLKIYIGDIEVEKKYTGYMAFARFVSDFSRGRKKFYINSFSRKNRKALKSLGVKYIRVSYKITGSRPVRKLFAMSGGKIPEEIVNCSD